jgi:prophage antirepressor-like protein
MAIQLFTFDDLKVRSTMHCGQPYFAVREIGEAMKYSDISQAAKLHVDPDYLTTMAKLHNSEATADLSGPVGFTGPTETHLPGLAGANALRELWVSEPGLYQLAVSSKKPEAKRFKRFVFEEVLPSLRKTGTYSVKNDQMSLLNETDLHESVVRFVRANYPTILMIAGLGETQTTDTLRIACWKKGYCKGQPDLMIPYKSGRFCGLAIELKTPAYYREPAPSQQAFLDNLHRGGWDVMVSSCYDEIIMKIVRYCDKVVAKRKRTSSASSRAASEETTSL